MSSQYCLLRILIGQKTQAMSLRLVTVWSVEKNIHTLQDDEPIWECGEILQMIPSLYVCITAGTLCNWNSVKKKCRSYTTPYNNFICSLDVEEKTAKKRWAFKTWLFQKHSVPHQDQVCTALSAAKTRKLFGRDLAAICEDGNLPAAILVGLTWFFSHFPKDKICFLCAPFNSVITWWNHCASNHPFRVGRQGRRATHQKPGTGDVGLITLLEWKIW